MRATFLLLHILCRRHYDMRGIMPQAMPVDAICPLSALIFCKAYKIIYAAMPSMRHLVTFTADGTEANRAKITILPRVDAAHLLHLALCISSRQIWRLLMP